MCLFEEVFNSGTGCNVYITPAAPQKSDKINQGFGAHWDDVDTYLFQLEGSKHWRLFFPDEKNILDLKSSSKDIPIEKLGKCIW